MIFKTLILRAWKFDLETKQIIDPIFVCPAMNTDMFNQPITIKQLELLQDWGYEIIWPIEKLLACKERGVGAMEEFSKIFERVDSFLKNNLN